MKKEIQLGIGLLFIWLASGCATSKDGIEFISAGQYGTAAVPTATAVPAAPQKLAREDVLKVQAVVYGHLLQRNFLKAGEYAAVFVQGDDAEVAALIKQFPDHVPPIKPSDQAELRPNLAPLDRQTGKPAMIFSVDTLDPVNDTVQAVGRWYAGAAVSGFETFALRKVGGEWAMEGSR